MPFAENVYVVAMLTLLATVDIVPPLDAHGNEAIPELQTTGRIARYVVLKPTRQRSSI